MSKNRKTILKHYRRAVKKTHSQFLQFNNPFRVEPEESEKVRMLLHKHDKGLGSIHKDFNDQIESVLYEVVKVNRKIQKVHRENDNLKLMLTFLVFTVMVIGVKVFILGG